MKNILLSVNGVGVISKNNFLLTSFERTVYPWELILVTKLGCIFPMVINSLLPHAVIGANDHREDTTHFTCSTFCCETPSRM